MTARGSVFGRNIPLFLVIWMVFVVQAAAQMSLSKTTDDIDTKYTSVGNIGLTVTNFGTIGDRNNYYLRTPSCEYPRGSKIEHIYLGGLWVGSVIRNKSNTSRDGQVLVTTGANDLSQTTRTSGEGLEFLPVGKDSLITVISSLSADRPAGSRFSALAVSHQDMITDYDDIHTHTPTGDSIKNHTPMGLRVHQESYAWNFPFADFFVIMRYVIYNAGVDTLDSVYVGIWNDAAVRNTNLVPPRTTGYFGRTTQGWDSTQRMAYSFDFDGSPGASPADSYVGVKLLGATPFPNGVDSLANLHQHSYFNAWGYGAPPGNALASPTFDHYDANPYLSRYDRMTHSMQTSDMETVRRIPQSRGITYLLSTGPFKSLNPGDSLEVVFAVVCAKKDGRDPARYDSSYQRKTLYANAAWAQQCYQGEDVHGTNQYDPQFDVARRDSISDAVYGLRYEPDGKITRYLLPAPPDKPKVRAVVENQSVVLYWDSLASQHSRDPISGKMDFEGYRIYRSKAGDDLTATQSLTLNTPMIAEFDRADDNVSNNTGFGKILLPPGQEKHFPGDPTTYCYRFPPIDDTVKTLNGWQYVYSVSAFDSGDAANNVPSLESFKETFRVIPGTPPTSAETAPVSVYPNPYYVNAAWDGARERLRKIYFCNLPAHCDITVFTLAGDIVTVLKHDAETYQGAGINWFDTYGTSTPPQFAGGEHAWDLITRNDQAIASGLYLYTVEDHDTGMIKRGKFLIVK